MTHRIAILGASGYTGAELVRLIATHPSMKIVALSGDRKAGMAMAEVFPFLAHLDLPHLVKIEDIDFSTFDLAFCALPHATSQAVISALPRDLKVVDLSADFRLRDPAEYEKWYGKPLPGHQPFAEARRPCVGWVGVPLRQRNGRRRTGRERGLVHHVLVLAGRSIDQSGARRSHETERGKAAV